MNSSYQTDCRCLPGYYGAEGGGGTCLACVPGKFSIAAGASLCQLCPAGTYSLQEAANSSDACQRCRADSPPASKCQPTSLTSNASFLSQTTSSLPRTTPYFVQKFNDSLNASTGEVAEFITTAQAGTLATACSSAAVGVIGISVAASVVLGAVFGQVLSMGSMNMMEQVSYHANIEMNVGGYLY